MEQSLKPIVAQLLAGLIGHLTSLNKNNFKTLILPLIIRSLRNFVDSVNKYARPSITSKKKSKYAIWLHEISKKLVFDEHAKSIAKAKDPVILRTENVCEDEVLQRYCSCDKVPHATTCATHDINIGLVVQIENSRKNKFSRMCAATGVHTAILENSLYCLYQRITNN